MPIRMLERMPKGVKPIDEFEVALDGRKLPYVVDDCARAHGYNDCPVHASVGQNPVRIYDNEPNVALVRVYPKDTA